MDTKKAVDKMLGNVGEHDKRIKKMLGKEGVEDVAEDMLEDEEDEKD